MLDKLVPVQAAAMRCRVEEYNGHLALRFEGDFFPSMLGVFFGFIVKPDTTRAEAEGLVEQFNRHCGDMLAGFRDHAGLSEGEQLALLETYDHMGLLGPDMDELRARCAPAATPPEVKTAA